jgi:hypothetical protein
LVEYYLNKIKDGVWRAVTRERIIGPNIFNKNINFELYLKLIIGDIQRIDKLLEGITSLITRQAMHYTAAFGRYRAIIVAIEKEYIVHILNGSL